MVVEDVGSAEWEDGERRGRLMGRGEEDGTEDIGFCREMVGDGGRWLRGKDQCMFRG